jgi:hypothetical protein
MLSLENYYVQSITILLTLYIPDDEFLIRNQTKITNIIPILQTKHLFIYFSI